MVLTFLHSLRLAQAGMIVAPADHPPCGGIGIGDWDFPLAAIFARLQGASDDYKRITILDQERQRFARHALEMETVDLAMRDELLAVEAKLAEWAQAIDTDMRVGRAAA
jgi:hypothetical protein